MFLSDIECLCMGPKKESRYRQRTYYKAIGQTVGNFFTLLFGQPHSAIRAALQSSQGKLPKNVEHCLGQPLSIFQRLFPALKCSGSGTESSLNLYLQTKFFLDFSFP